MHEFGKERLFVIKKRIVIKIFILTVFILILSTIHGYAQEDIITVDDSAFQSRMRPPVSFVHDEHNDLANINDCSTCHHAFDNNLKKIKDDSSEDMECSECHLKDEQNFINLIKTYHNRCKGCHLEKKSGPVICSGCHKRNRVDE